MLKKKYVQKAKDAILNRVKFHAPVLYDDKVDLKTLFLHGLNVNLPIFVFDKILTKPLLKAFELASCEENFNLLFSKRSVAKLEKVVQKKLPKAMIFDETFGGNFLETVGKLNINYPSSSNYNLVFKDRFFKVNGQILNPHFEDFSLRQVEVIKNVFVDYQESVLNGVNFFCALQNRAANPVRGEIELNIPLAKGYYYFKKMSHAILIENLLTKEKFFLNYFCRNAKFLFSNVDGLENSVFSCINIKANLNFSSKEENFVFFNFGKSKFLPKNLDQIKSMAKLAWQKSCEVFNLQVKTKNPKFDFFFNKTLPQKIWVNWLNGEVDDDLERKYVAYRKLFLKGELESTSNNKSGRKEAVCYENITSFGREKDCSNQSCRQKVLQKIAEPKGLTLVNFEKIGLRELGIFNGQYYKKIFIVKGDEKFLKVGRTFFYNICGITERSLTSREPISVCFGQGM